MAFESIACHLLDCSHQLPLSSVIWTKRLLKMFRESLGNLKGVTLTTDDVANAALFLASDDAKYISGQNLNVDGVLLLSSNVFKQEYSLRWCLFFGQKHFWPLMSASRRRAQTFEVCSLFVFRKHFSPKRSSPPLPHTDLFLCLQTSSEPLLSTIQNTDLCITSTTTSSPPPPPPHLRHHLHPHISATTTLHRQNPKIGTSKSEHKTQIGLNPKQKD
ncbi:putative xanthoxin dehydrogenase [Helianthus annuus]|nr:putative xanthoxin dehydrogenase [Helianthus annuus]KAJ0793620.1 putative xanthoxin dehydrogenase [Helianthus annuus]